MELYELGLPNTIQGVGIQSRLAKNKPLIASNKVARESNRPMVATQLR